MRCSCGPLESRSSRWPDRTVGAFVLATVALLGDCSQTTGPGPGWLTAAIREGTGSAARVSQYEGTGEFTTGSDPGAGVSVAFELDSRGSGRGAGQTMMLYRPGQGQPVAGRYELGPLAVLDGRLDGLTAFFVRTAGGLSESFTALSGYVVVRASSADRFEGEFQFTGVMYCSASENPGPADWCTEPTRITPGAPQVEVTGSFAAVPYRPGVQTLDVPDVP